MDRLQTPIEYLKGVGPAKAELLQKELGIFTFNDLLNHYPFRYVDRTKINRITDIRPGGTEIQLKGHISEIREVGIGRQKRLVARLSDASGSIELIWFRGAKWIREILHEGREYTVFGKPNWFRSKASIPHPEMRETTKAKEINSLHLYPVYPGTEKLKSRGLDSRGLQKLTRQLILDLTASDLPEFIPVSLLQKHRLTSRFVAMRQIHFPKNQENLSHARRRLKFEELFLIQLKLIKLRLFRKKSHNGYVFGQIGEVFNRFYSEVLTFELTGAQKKVLKEIRRDLLDGTQMNRLLQGDVGSGKTIVALMAMLMAIDNDFQACLMAPTEILARQHYASISEMLQQLGLSTGLLTGTVKGAERRNVLSALKEGQLHLLIGTHALIEETVIFKNLGLVVIDEQHRFGVAQRARMWTKNLNPPHVLVMTATPIPRTLAMTLYGDLDYSVIDELPPGRKVIQTLHKSDRQRPAVFGFLRSEIANGRQVYIVYPLIKESAKMDYKDLMDGYESVVRSFPPPEYRISIVHGQMKPMDKEREMARFVEGKSQILVATTVIEVGVNVPNASVMVIESAERFGLAQLHQLRGRVGRGSDQSYNILMTADKLSADAMTRMSTMVETTDGFRISEVDMELRGPGDLQGTRQSGTIELKISNLLDDGPVLATARKDAQYLLETDPTLKKSENSALKTFLLKDRELKGDWSDIS